MAKSFVKSHLARCFPPPRKQDPQLVLGAADLLLQRRLFLEAACYYGTPYFGVFGSANLANRKRVSFPGSFQLFCCALHHRWITSFVFLFLFPLFLKQSAFMSTSSSILGIFFANPPDFYQCLWLFSRALFSVRSHKHPEMMERRFEQIL